VQKGAEVKETLSTAKGEGRQEFDETYNLWQMIELTDPNQKTVPNSLGAVLQWHSQRT
jgi:hypothetical protein